MRYAFLILLVTGCSKVIVEQPVTNTTTNSTTLSYTCVDHHPYPLGDIKIRCKSKDECVRVCK